MHEARRDDFPDYDFAGRLALPAALSCSLADPVRLSIVPRLSHGEARVVDLTRELELAQSTISRQLACLRTRFRSIRSIRDVVR